MIAEAAMYLRILRPGTFQLVRPRVFRPLAPLGIDLYLVSRRRVRMPGFFKSRLRTRAMAEARG